MEQQQVWYLGVDWGRTRHQACVMAASGEVLGNQGFVHSGAGLAQLVQWCLNLTGSAASQVCVAVETSHGPVIETLLWHAMQVHSINPRQSSRFRDRHCVSGAKDDRRDAMVLADALRTDAHAFRRKLPTDRCSSKLTRLLRSRHQLTTERTRLNNQFLELLWSYYPQFLTLGDDLTRQWVLALWQLVPTPHKARRVRQATVEKLLRSHGVRSQSAEQILDILRQPALSVTTDEVDSVVDEIQLLVERLELNHKQTGITNKRLDQCLRQMDEDNPTANGCDDHDATTSCGDNQLSDVAIIRSMPGAGRLVTATLIAKAGDALQVKSHGALRCLCGVAPVTKSSGRMHLVQRRRAADPQLCQAVYHWARVAIQHDSISRDKYSRLRSKGHSHARALRSVADRMLSVLCAMLRDRTVFESRAQVAVSG